MSRPETNVTFYLQLVGASPDSSTWVWWPLSPVWVECWMGDPCTPACPHSSARPGHCSLCSIFWGGAGMVWWCCTVCPVQLWESWEESRASQLYTAAPANLGDQTRTFGDIESLHNKEVHSVKGLICCHTVMTKINGVSMQFFYVLWTNSLMSGFVAISHILWTLPFSPSVVIVLNVLQQFLAAAASQLFHLFPLVLGGREQSNSPACWSSGLARAVSSAPHPHINSHAGPGRNIAGQQGNLLFLARSFVFWQTSHRGAK